MANIVTNTNVFDFMGTPADVRTTQGTMVTSLITQIQAELESVLRRKVTSQTLTIEYLQHGMNCTIEGDIIFLDGVLRDTYSITALTEEGTSLTASTAYNDGNDYIFWNQKGTVQKLGSNWSTANLAVAITGKYGYVNSSDDSAREDMKLVIIEWTAARSGLWKKTFISPEGVVTTQRDAIDKIVINKIRSHINYSI